MLLLTVIHEAIQLGVNKVITISVDEASLSFVSSIVEKFPGVYGSVGFHPHDASSLTELLEKRIIDLANENEKLIAIGETGLDYHYMNSPAEVQKKVFRKHIQISKITNLSNSSFEIIKLRYFPRTSNNKISFNELRKINARL